MDVCALGQGATLGVAHRRREMDQHSLRIRSMPNVPARRALACIATVLVGSRGMTAVRGANAFVFPSVRTMDVRCSAEKCPRRRGHVHGEFSRVKRCGNSKGPPSVAPWRFHVGSRIIPYTPTSGTLRRARTVLRSSTGEVRAHHGKV